MSEEIRVRVVEFSDRRHYQLQWTCPNTGRKKTKSSGVERVTGTKRERDEASKAAGEWEKQLRAGDVPQNPRMTWEQFRARYEREAMPNMAKNSCKRVEDAFRSVERIIKPTLLSHITTTAVSQWLTQLQTEGRAPATAGAHGRMLRSAMNWAKAMGLIQKAPVFKIPRKQAGESLAKGRAIVGEEHDRMKAAVSKVIKQPYVAAWEMFLDALWWSGLRLGEALALSWESSADVTAIVIDGQRPVVRFRAAGQKARRDEIWPCPPEFAVILEAIPEDERTGLVFKLPQRGRGWTGQQSPDKAGGIISAIGAKAGVIVGDGPDDNATAHTYRRSFGTRWAKRVMPAVLKRLMRHRNINTTLLYYVDADAAQIADELWQQFRNGNTCGNKPSESALIP